MQYHAFLYISCYIAEILITFLKVYSRLLQYYCNNSFAGSGSGQIQTILGGFDQI